MVFVEYFDSDAANTQTPQLSLWAQVRRVCGRVGVAFLWLHKKLIKQMR